MQILIIKSSQTSDFKLLKKYQKKIQLLVPAATLKVISPDSKDFSQLAKKAEIVIGMADTVSDSSLFPALKWLHLTSAGANALSKEVTNSDVVISNSSGIHPVPISEHVFGLMLMLARGLQKAVRVQVTQQKWVRDINYYQPSELAGKQLLVVGMGRIGERVAHLGQGFEMQVTGVVRNPATHKTAIKLVATQDLVKELKKADYIVNCLPSTTETVGLFSKELLKNFKKGSFFINIGRGDTVDEVALAELLKTGHLAGAGLDVFETEPLGADSPLWQMENVIITPHYSGANPHYFERMMEIFLANFKAYIEKKPLPNQVDKKLGY